MAESRPPLAPSSSFSGSSSPIVVSRPLKRALSSAADLDFFTPAASSFKPRPYTPHSASATADSSRRYSHFTRNNQRNVDSTTLGTSMDPSPNDPGVVFIHPPFTAFPGSQNYPEGLSYALLAENPEWFLIPTDFITLESSSPNAIPYPSALEPPRGWCPAKKKDLQDRGPELWPEGEEPRLRCTFCRRNYAGVNAKSMWRRHVFEKHKIAMANRRENGDRPRGRGSAKENRKPTYNRPKNTHDRLVTMTVTPYAEALGESRQSRFRPDTDQEGRKTTTKRHVKIEPDSDQLPCTPPPTPPLSPVDMSSDPSTSTLDLSTEKLTLSPTLPTIPPSPYDPSLTPAFRHSPPCLPSDQPWRFPSPSHPLHSRQRDLSLYMLLRHSPRVSPNQSTPSRSIHKPIGVGKSLLDTPESLVKFPRLSPRTLFLKSRPPTPTAAGACSERTLLSTESPLIGRGLGDMQHRKTVSVESDDWLGEASLASSLRGDLPLKTILPDPDPFVVAFNWDTISSNDTEGCDIPSLSLTDNPRDSPIIRTNELLPSDAGSGIGLLEPFTLGGRPPSLDSPIAGKSRRNASSRDAAEEDEVFGVLTCTDPDAMNAARRESTPPLKRRRTTMDSYYSLPSPNSFS